jgi:hypothetical protein
MVRLQTNAAAISAAVRRLRNWSGVSFGFDIPPRSHAHPAPPSRP